METRYLSAKTAGAPPDTIIVGGVALVSSKLIAGEFRVPIGSVPALVRNIEAAARLAYEKLPDATKEALPWIRGTPTIGCLTIRDTTYYNLIAIALTIHVATAPTLTIDLPAYAAILKNLRRSSLTAQLAKIGKTVRRARDRRTRRG